MTSKHISRENVAPADSEQQGSKIYTTICNNKVWYLCVENKNGKPNYHFRASIHNLPRSVSTLSELPEGYQVDGTTVNKKRSLEDIFTSLHR